MLRAYVHFLLVNLYGQPYTKEGALDTKSVPLKLDTDLEKVLKRNTVEEVYTSIQADIDEARKLVTKGRMGTEIFISFQCGFGRGVSITRIPL